MCDIEKLEDLCIYNTKKKHLLSKNEDWETIYWVERLLNQN